MDRRVFTFPIIAGFISALIFGVGFSSLILLVAPNEFWGWVGAAMATLISAILAVTVGIILFNVQSKQIDAANRTRLSDLLRIELDETLEALTATPIEISLPAGTQEVVLTNVQSLVLEDAARSGLFGTEITRDMFSLARMVHIYNGKVTNVVSVVLGGQGSESQSLPVLLKDCDIHRRQTVNKIREVQDSI